MENFIELHKIHNVENAEQFKLIWEQEIASPHLPNVIIENDQIWLDILENYPEFEYIVIQYPVSPRVLAQLAVSKDDDIRGRVARFRRLNLATFHLLAQDPNPFIRKEIALNPKCPKPILQQLIDDPINQVAEFAYKNLQKRTE